MLLADLHQRFMPGACRVSALERHLHFDLRLLLGLKLQHPAGEHDGNLSAKHLSRHRTAVLDDESLLLWPRLRHLHRHGLRHL